MAEILPALFPDKTLPLGIGPATLYAQLTFFGRVMAIVCTRVWTHTCVHVYVLCVHMWRETRG